MEGFLSAFSDGEWDSTFRNILNDDAGFVMHQLLNDEVGEGSSSSSIAPAFWSSIENNTNFAEASQSFSHPLGSFYSDSYKLSSHYGFNGQGEVGVVPSLSPENYYIAEPDNGVPLEFCMMDFDASQVQFLKNTVAGEGTFIDGVELDKSKPDILTPAPTTQLNLKRRGVTSESPNKKSCEMKDACGNKVNIPSNKSRKTSKLSDDEAINNSAKQMSSPHSSEEDSNASQELRVGTSPDPKLVASHDQNGKKTGQGGSTIDPQSLYARKRRERINERLRILQNLVPNGTKVDISTMLEEAVSYVKFLQTQIKLLSSDDMWMYAPIAYNGVAVGLDLNLSHSL
ncbi:hypothetical protein QQ045_002670 [Rhodiola kirilowii]